MTRCMFVDEWDCPVNYDEFPLEVCKICIKARSIRNETTKIQIPEDGKRVEKEAEDISKMIKEVQSGGEDRKVEKSSGKEKYSHEKLNKKFHEGELSVEEYIKKRKELPKIPETEQG